MPTSPAPWPVVTGAARTVLTEDGIDLHVVEHGPGDAAGSVVLLHGYELDQTLWARQVEALRDAHPDQRVVTYDHRGHGRSGRTAPDAATLAQLGRDLKTVLDALPEGPVTLVGHSMGGMTIMAFAELFPEQLGDRVVAVGLVATSSGGLSELTFGMPARVARVAHHVVPRFNAMSHRRELRGRRRPVQPGMRWLLFGESPERDDVLRALAALARCPASSAEAFYWTFRDHDRTHALQALSAVPVLVACGDRDRLTPLEHSRTIATALPHAQLVVYPGAGHMLMLERAGDLSRRLVALVASGLRTAAQPAG